MQTSTESEAVFFLEGFAGKQFYFIFSATAVIFVRTGIILSILCMCCMWRLCSLSTLRGEDMRGM
jgi:hypothetical protein